MKKVMILLFSICIMYGACEDVSSDLPKKRARVLQERIESRRAVFADGLVQAIRIFPDLTERLGNEVEITGFLDREEAERGSISSEEKCAFFQLEKQTPWNLKLSRMLREEAFAVRFGKAAGLENLFMDMRKQGWNFAGK